MNLDSLKFSRISTISTIYEAQTNKKICTFLQFAPAAKKSGEVENRERVSTLYNEHFMTDNNDSSGESQH